MPCDNVLVVRTTAVLGLLFVAGVVRSELVVSTDPEPTRSYIARRMEVREDASTGRLVRKVSYHRGASPKQAAIGRHGSGNKVVQGLDLDRLIRDIGSRHDVDPELIHAVIRQESNYDPFAVSPKGALGLMQLLPSTAERFGVKDVFVPAENIQGGVKYLRYLMDRYPRQAALVLAAYNAGEGAVDRYGGIPPYQETQAYVARISERYSPSSEIAPSKDDETARPRIVASVTPDGMVVLGTR